MAKKIPEEIKLEPGWLKRQTQEANKNFQSYPQEIQAMFRIWGKSLCESQNDTPGSTSVLSEDQARTSQG